MKLILSVLFFFFILRVSAQVEDHFDDGNFIVSPTWTGDDSEFNVNSSGQLQLNAIIAGNSGLSVVAALTTLDSCEWRIYVKLGFSPSASNYARVYLSADQTDLSTPLNGYFLQFGESLSADAIELYRQNGTALTLICRGQDGHIADPFAVNIKVTRMLSGQWTIATDYSGGNNYVEETAGFDSSINVADKIGIFCNYTSGNINKFFFDDVYAGKIIPDTVLPSIVAVNAESGTELLITFSEIVKDASALNILNYYVDEGIGYPDSVVSNALDAFKYHLNFGNPFFPGQNYSIAISGITDINDNELQNQSFSFAFHPLIEAGNNDIIFTEIYFHNSPISPLPDGEYIELYNRRDSSVLFSGWKISDGNTEGLIPATRLGPHEYLLLHGEGDSGFNFQNAIEVPSFPSLNNDGDQLVLTNSSGDTISVISFTDRSYRDDEKDGGGWSIERIDERFICDDELNWKASEAIGHGTPGQVNSVNGIYVDEKAPYADNVYVSGINSVIVEFSEDIFHGLSDVNNYIITEPNGGITHPVSMIVTDKSKVELILWQDISHGIYSLSLSMQIKDCSGNSALPGREQRFGISEKAFFGDVIINEILFDPYEDGTDYLELLNTSQKIINVKSWVIAEADYIDSTIIKDNALITTNPKLIFPGDFFVLSAEERKVKNNYSCENLHAFINIESMPDFNSDEGRAIIYDDGGYMMGDLQYSTDMHFQLLAETKGVSLERLSSKTDIDTKFNWHSAAATAGFGTPGYRNSQRIVSSRVDGEVSIGSEIFSPDNDGYQDILAIHYKFQQTGNVLSLNVYDFKGLPVRTILGGDMVGIEGTLNWDGFKDDNTAADSGIYIILASSFDLEGNTSVTKKVCYLTRKM